MSGASYGCELWLEAERGTNALLLILHNTLPLQTYSVWSIGDLTQTNWSNSGELITATNTTATASDVIGADRQRYYRVVLSP